MPTRNHFFFFFFSRKSVFILICHKNEFFFPRPYNSFRRDEIFILKSKISTAYVHRYLP